MDYNCKYISSIIIIENLIDVVNNNNRIKFDITVPF